jgi:hypothetical protein
MEGKERRVHEEKGWMRLFKWGEGFEGLDIIPNQMGEI